MLFVCQKLMNLWGHVTFLRASEVFEFQKFPILVTVWWKTEIGYFWVEGVVFFENENVLKFQIPMAVTFEMNVFDTLADFFK